MATSPSANGDKDKQKEKERKLKEKEKERAQKEKEREKAQKEKEKQKEKAQKEKEKAQKLKEKEKEKKEREKEKSKAKTPTKGKEDVKVKAPKPTEDKKAPKPVEKEGEKKAPKEGEEHKASRKLRKEKLKQLQSEGLPRRPQNAPMLYVADARAAFVKKNPGIKPTEVFSGLHTAYKALPADQKKKYEDKYAVAKEKYRKEMDAFRAAHPKVSKRPLGAYAIFVKTEIVKELKAKPGSKVTELMKALGAKWQTLSEEQKKPYHKQAAQKKVEFEKQQSNQSK